MVRSFYGAGKLRLAAAVRGGGGTDAACYRKKLQTRRLLFFSSLQLATTGSKLSPPLSRRITNFATGATAGSAESKMYLN
jgi:hypothetical protein